MSNPSLHDAVALLEAGQQQEAHALLEDLTRRHPLHATVHVLLARLHEAAGRQAEALQAWQRAQFLVPNSPEIQAGLVRLFRLQAKAALLPAPEETPQDAEEAQGEREVEVGDVETQDETAEAPRVEDRASRIEDGERDDQLEVEEAEEEPAEAAAPEAEEAPEAAEAAEDEAGPSEEASDEETHELDRLIAALEGARIEPDPDFEPPLPDLEDEVDDLVSETLARIYTAQRQYDEAARVYEKLATQQPTRAVEFLEKAVELREKAARRDD